MVNNYMQATITPVDLIIPDDYAAAFKLLGATVDDGYIYFEEGLTDLDDLPQDGSEVARLAHLDFPLLLRELLLLNVVDYLHYEAAYRSDKMQFGGSGIVVTRTHYMYMGSGFFSFNGGVLRSTATPVPFEV